jgi:alkaline phosphatase D
MPDMLKLAVASCQHWEFGSYAAHRHIAAAAPDLVAFLGDYIYEWGAFQLQHPQRAVRQNESFTLASYRQRYAQYKTDPDLQAAHLAAPWIVTWDDHEVANDYAATATSAVAGLPGAPRGRLPGLLRAHAAAPAAAARLRRNVRMFQRYDWGRLARFHVLDDRQYRAHQACPGRRLGGSNSVGPRACPALLDPAARCWAWSRKPGWRTGLKSSKARWNILAQQTLMAQSSQVPIANAGRRPLLDRWLGRLSDGARSACSIRW